MTGVPAVLLAFAMSGADDNAIHQVFSWLVKTWNSHDMKAHCSVFAPDADFVNVNGWWWQGREEIARQHTTAHETVFKTTVAEIAPKKIRLLKRDVAVVQASWRVTGDVRSKDPRDYIMTYVLRKQGRNWLIVAAQNSSAEDRSSSSHPLNVSLATPVSFAASDQKRRDPAVLSPDERDIARTLGKINQAWRSADVKAAVSFYRPDADLVSVRAEWFMGTADIERYQLSLRSATNGAWTRTSDLLKIRLLHPDTAVVTERWTVTSTQQAGGGSSGLGLLVMTKEKGAWKAVASQNTITRGNSGRTTVK